MFHVKHSPPLGQTHRLGQLLSLSRSLALSLALSPPRVAPPRVAPPLSQETLRNWSTYHPLRGGRINYFHSERYIKTCTVVTEGEGEGGRAPPEGLAQAMYAGIH